MMAHSREIDSKGIRHIKNFEASVDDHIQNVLGLPIRQTDRIEQIRQLLFQNITLVSVAMYMFGLKLIDHYVDLCMLSYSL